MPGVLLFIGGCAAAALLHSYVIYPAYLQWAERRLPPPVPLLTPAEWPFVSVLIAAYNEARVIIEKLDSLLRTEYPADRIRVFIGSDCSADRTNELVSAYAAQHEQVHFYPFTVRRGKPGVINQLAEYALSELPAGPEHLFLMTDANVLLDEHTLPRLVGRLLSDATLALVDSHLVHHRPGSAGIGRSEQTYINREVHLKYREGRLWQCMIGPFGGCYLLRADYFSPVPTHYLVDDFYLAMRTFERGGRAVNELTAYSYEAVGEQLSEEFRRKARISTGNVQNLLTFRKLWWPPTGALGFAFFSHKILRWLGPFWLLLLYGSALGVYLLRPASGGVVFWALTVGLFGLPLLDWCLQQLRIQIQPLRAVRYFLLMNVALAVGWWRFWRGEQQGIWEPPERVG